MWTGNKLDREKERDMKGKREQKTENLLSGLHKQKSDFAFVYFLDVHVYFYILELWMLLFNGKILKIVDKRFWSLW